MTRPRLPFVVLVGIVAILVVSPPFVSGDAAAFSTPVAPESQMQSPVTGAGGANDRADRTVDDRPTAAAPDAPLALAMADRKAAPNTTVTVAFTVTNTNGTSIPGVVLNVTEYPSNWSIIGHTDDDGRFRSRTNEWLWFPVDAGATMSPTLTFHVPNRTAPGGYRIAAEARTLDFVTTANATVTITSSDGPSIRDAIDGSDDHLSTQELLTAIDLWETNTPVPDTGGKTITTPKLLQLIEVWVQGGLATNG